MQAYLDLLFIMNVAFILTHELDAIRQREWRFFFAPFSISDQNAYRIFTALHVPLFMLIIWNLSFFSFQVGFDIFLIVHAGLHWLLREHPLIDFNNGFSRLWIFFGGLLGALHLALLFWL